MNHAGRRSGTCMGVASSVIDETRQLLRTYRHAHSSCPPVDLPREGWVPRSRTRSRGRSDGGSPIQYSEEFKRDTVALVRSTRSSPRSA